MEDARELEMLHNSLVISVITYAMPLWGGASRYLLGRIDEVQQKAVRLGLIDKFTPITVLLRNTDSKLLNEIAKAVSQHGLHSYILTRNEYSEGLRRRLPPPRKTKWEKELTFFPNRALLYGGNA